MEKLFNLLLIIVFSMIVAANPVFAGRGYISGGYGGGYGGGGYSGHDYSGHNYSGADYSGHNYSGNGHSNHYNHGAGAAIFGLDAAIKGSAINNKCKHERETADEHNAHYSPTHPTQCQDHCNDGQNSDHHHSGDSAPGQ